MNIVDSSGWLEYFADGPNAEIFSQPLHDVDNLIVPNICLYEVFKVVLGERDEDAAFQAVALMKQGQVVDLTPEIAIQAAKTSFDLEIPMVDAIILTTALRYQATIWTQDDDLEGMPGVKYFRYTTL